MKKKKLKIWRRILLIVIILMIYIFTKPIHLTGTITIAKGDTVSKILNKLPTMEKYRIKWYAKSHSIDFSKLEPGNYIFSGNYSKSNFVKDILAWPTNNYARITVLEGRSIYDVDAALTKKWYIKGGEYIAFVTNPGIIAKYQQRYTFLNETVLNHSPLTTLEWFLYPDTYNVDTNKDIIDQLVYLQLEAFNTKVQSKFGGDTAGKLNNFTRGHYSSYDLITLASILEKEERNPTNKPIVAGIFFKRLNNGISLGADVSLCYGLHEAYSECTPSVIGQHVADKNNPYNTREQRWLTPTPISNPSAETISAVLNYQDSEYLFYLHGSDGTIHYGKTLEEHNANKTQYLK